MGQNNEYSSINQKVIYVKVLFYGLREERERYERKHQNEMECENSYRRLAEMKIAFHIHLHTFFYALYCTCSLVPKYSGFKEPREMIAEILTQQKPSCSGSNYCTRYVIILEGN